MATGPADLKQAWGQIKIALAASSQGDPDARLTLQNMEQAERSTAVATIRRRATAFSWREPAGPAKPVSHPARSPPSRTLAPWTPKK
jgi:hypothetical protein